MSDCCRTGNFSLMEVTSGQEPSSHRYRHGYCIIKGCLSSRKKNPGLRYHMVPTKDLPKLKRWLLFLNLDLNTPVKTLQGHVICQKHFLRSDYESNAKKRRLNADAVPSVGINFLAQPIMDKMAVLKAWEETTLTPALSDDELLTECDEDELTLTLSSEEDEGQTDPTGSSVPEESQETQAQENKELPEDEEMLLFAPIEEEDNEEEEVQVGENEAVQMEERPAAEDARLHPPPDWTAPAPKRTRLHSPERSSHGPQSSASRRSLAGFKINGRHVSLLPEGGGVKLKLTSRTGGSACGFTCIELRPELNATPVHTSYSKTPPVHQYNNSTPVHSSNSKTTPVHHFNNITPVHTSNSKTKPVLLYNSFSKTFTSLTSNTLTSLTPPKTDGFPVITGVACGSAAEVLSRGTVNSSYKATLMPAKQVVKSCVASLLPYPVFPRPPPFQPQTPTPSGSKAHSLHNKPSPESGFSSRGRLLKPKGQSLSPRTEFQKGLRRRARPPDCTVCHSQYKMVSSLRGFVCLCSMEIIRCLRQTHMFKGHFKKKHRLPRSTFSSADRQTVSQTSKTRAPSLLPPPIPPASPARHHPSRVTPPMPHLSPVSPLRQQQLAPPLSSPLSSTSCSAPARLHPSSSAPPPPPPQPEKLVILVEDFFYGTDEGPGSKVTQSNGTTITDRTYECDCRLLLPNNISFLSHVQQHIMDDLYVSDTNHCHHCYRNFQTPFRLQRHLEVHSAINVAPTCKICELSYDNEAALLNHMKSTHKPGEMPYICQVCEYRSSFYSSVVRHFREAHVNTHYLMCVYCLRVFKSRAAYQQHIGKHKRKNLYSCVRCRLLFLYARDRQLHKETYHKTHIRPRQLEGLKPGTRVTVRSSLSADSVNDHTANCQARSLEVSRGPGSSRHLNNTETPPMIVLTDDDSNDETDTSRDIDIVETTKGGLEPAPSELPTSSCCIECKQAVSGGLSHFSAGVRCSMCTYVTYCSRAYANHMMSNHVIDPGVPTPSYSSMYRLYPRLPVGLRCQSCTYVTTTGDMMANHLAEHPGHCAMAVTDSEDQTVSKSGGGSFPIHLLPAGPASPQLSINTLPSAGPASPQLSINTLPSPPPTLPSTSPTLLSPSPTLPSTSPTLPSTSPTLPSPPPTLPSPPPTLPSPPPTLPSPHPPLPSTYSLGISAITLTFRKPQTTQNKKASEKKMSTRSQRPPPLSVSELQMVLYALCNGVPQAAQCFRSDPALIRAWTLQQAQDTNKDNTHSSWNSERLAEWVLAQREQQLCISEDSLMRAATNALKASSCGLREAYCWAVNFMLSQNLSLQPVATPDSRGPNRRLPRNLNANAKTFTHFLQKQLQTGLPPVAVGFMDELSIFIDMERLSSSAFSMFSSPADTPPLVDIVLSGLADGTCCSLMIFYTGASPVLPQGFPTNITLLAEPDGFTEQRRLDLWHHKVWRPHVSNHSRSVLILDTHRGHLNDHFLSTLSSSHTAPVVIPIGCSSRLQPLDVCITPVVREFLQARWSQLLSSGGVEGMRVEQLVVTLCCWLSEVASALSDHQDILRRSFAMVSATPGKKMELEGVNEMIQTLTKALID